jgi:hypothetical protein
MEESDKQYHELPSDQAATEQPKGRMQRFQSMFNRQVDRVHGVVGHEIPHSQTYTMVAICMAGLALQVLAVVFMVLGVRFFAIVYAIGTITVICGTFVAVRLGRQIAACKMSHPKLFYCYCICFAIVILVAVIFGFGLFNLIVIIIAFLIQTGAQYMHLAFFYPVLEIKMPAIFKFTKLVRLIN